MRGLVVLGGVLLALLVANPASAVVLPHEEDWKRAAEKAHYDAVPAPSDLPDFVFGGVPGSDGERGIGGYYRRMPRKGRCPRFTYQSVYGFFFRPSDAASLSTSYGRETPACSRGADTRRYERIGRVRALGTRIALYRLPEFAPTQTSYALRGKLRGQRFHLELVYQTGDVPRTEIVRIVRGMRWVRRPAPCAPVIASKHRLVRAREVMSQERFATFSFPASPGVGVYVHEVFIAAKQVKLEGNVAGDVIAAVGNVIERVPGAKLVVRAKGDGRKHAQNFDPERVRAFVVLDFERGSGYLVANHSTVRIQAKFKPGVVGPTLTKTLYSRSFSARGITTAWQGGNNWLDAGWVTPDTFRLRYGLRASGPGGTLIMNTIDHQLLIDRRSGAVTFEGDRYPSTGTYRNDCAGRTQTMHRQFEAKLANLGDDPAFSYDAPVTGVQPGD